MGWPGCHYHSHSWASSLLPDTSADPREPSDGQDFMGSFREMAKKVLLQPFCLHPRTLAYVARVTDSTLNSKSCVPKIKKLKLREVNDLLEVKQPGRRGVWILCPWTLWSRLEMYTRQETVAFTCLVGFRPD